MNHPPAFRPPYSFSDVYSPLSGGGVGEVSRSMLDCSESWEEDGMDGRAGGRLYSLFEAICTPTKCQSLKSVKEEARKTKEEEKNSH